ncbi:hypothetical protein ACLOJK_031906 [Asimina triloba]
MRSSRYPLVRARNWEGRERKEKDMTIDDDNSIYVGGLPYDSTEEDLKRAFDLYGAVVAVKIINDREVGGKCYGFVTFTNPRSAIDAINDMNGRTIGGRVVRVNEVRTRGGRTNFNRENFHRDMDWDRGRDRERDYDRDRGRYRDRHNDRSRDHERERDRDYDSGREYDRPRDRFLDHEREEPDKEHNHSHDLDWDRDKERDREMDDANEHDKSRDKDKEHPSKVRGSQLGDRRSRGSSSDSSDEEYHDQVKEQLEVSLKRHEELQKEFKHHDEETGMFLGVVAHFSAIAQIEEKYDEKQKLVSDLQKKSQKLEDALVAAKKLSSQRLQQMAKSLVDMTMMEAYEGEEIGLRDAAPYANGKF